MATNRNPKISKIFRIFSSFSFFFAIYSVDMLTSRQVVCISKELKELRSSDVNHRDGDFDSCSICKSCIFPLPNRLLWDKNIIKPYFFSASFLFSSPYNGWDVGIVEKNRLIQPKRKSLLLWRKRLFIHSEQLWTEAFPSNGYYLIVFLNMPP